MIKQFIVKRLQRLTVKLNHRALLRLANMPLDAKVKITFEENKLLTALIEKIEPSRYATVNGKIVYALPDLETITLWAMLETRRAEDSLERIHAWSSGKYSPDNIATAAKMDKFIVDTLKQADSLEDVILQSMRKGSGSSAGDPIAEAKNILGLVQITSELFKCTFEEAKGINYTDAILAIAKKNDEIEKEKQELKQRK